MMTQAIRFQFGSIIRHNPPPSGGNKENEMLTFKKMEWNDDLVGYEVELSNGKHVQIEFGRETNRLHADFGTFSAEIDRTNEYGLDITEEENDQIYAILKTNEEIKAKELELENEQQ